MVVQIPAQCRLTDGNTVCLEQLREFRMRDAAFASREQSWLYLVEQTTDRVLPFARFPIGQFGEGS